MYSCLNCYVRSYSFFRYVCDDAYSRQEIMAKERDMIETVNYDVGYPLSYRFLRRFGRVSLN